ncbi:flagellar M-ring protein FliF [Rhodoferax sp. 4810]|uniref:Flagellar M-ring protein n=1 Tax=Thiospirillum jenense TaxID=1653858 RepID=A0A839HFG7_9GAMM|nr:flagellar basal-body MS-ring/collar protein FliF [Thiospirillum jenense]MBB1075441.1 flagellar M-ring protein FliF [Rhodoferax jenense]MBB1126820.1 flagellar M-ring protein FliF [Thiospirillum jenense]
MTSAALSTVVTTGIKNFTELTIGRRLAIIGMIIGGLAVIVGLLLWAFQPSYGVLFTQIKNNEAAEVMKALDKLGVPYLVDTQSGQIQVPHKRIAETRLQLAGLGLPKQADIGFELLQQDNGFGTSRLMESALHQRALEGELGRSITALDAVEQARVHLAQPEQSVFVRERAPASASVVVHLHDERKLATQQVAAIVHLVSSSVPGLKPENVTVVDQSGRLLTADKDQVKEALADSHEQLDYTRRVEASYVERVQALLVPIFGAERVRVQVSAEIDFSRVERTQETYDPDRIAIRSEQINEEERTGNEGTSPMGVPGALTNQPPAGGTLGDQAESGGIPKRRSLHSTRNYEVDRAISHVRESSGNIRRLSTAVVVDYLEKTDEQGAVTRIPRPEAELESLRALVREAVGFDEKRGDSINVISAAFNVEEDIYSGPIWTQPWFIELAKLGAAVILALLILLTVVRPGIRQLFPKPEPESTELLMTDEHGNVIRMDRTNAEGEEAEGDGEKSAEGEDKIALSPTATALAALTGPKEADPQQQELDHIRHMIREDPKRVAQVMKIWLASDGKD